MNLPNIPTAVTRAESKALQAIVRGKHVVEIGALLGYSTVVMGQVAEQVYSIDPHTGYPESNPRDTYARYLCNLAKHGVRDRVIPLRGTWQDVMGPRGAFGWPYDVVFMDLTGRYEDTLECLMYFHPEWGWRLNTIAVHDCGHSDWPGVDQAVAEFREFMGIHILFEQVDKLGIFRYV